MIVCGGMALALLALLVVLFLLLTSGTPLALPQEDFTEEDCNALADRWMSFQRDIADALPVPVFQATSRDLNVFISMMPRLNSRVHGRFEGNRISSQFSMPLSNALRTRHLTGTATVRLGMKNQQLEVDVESCRINGHALPRWLCRQLGRKSLNPEAFWLLEESRLLVHLKSIEIREGSLLLTPKPRE